jgi:hypothetical protein
MCKIVLYPHVDQKKVKQVVGHSWKNWLSYVSENSIAGRGKIPCLLGSTMFSLSPLVNHCMDQSECCC